jgi:hypothetical protein
VPATDTLYQIRTRRLQTLERGRDNTLRVEVYDGGVAVPPASGTVSVYDGSNTAVVSDAAVTAGGTGASYLVAAAVTSSLELGEGWRIEWTLTMADSTVRLIRETAALVLCSLHPPAIGQDLFNRVSSLDPAGSRPITAKTAAEFDRYLDEAWLAIERRLRRDGRRPWLVCSSADLFDLHVVTALTLVFEDLATRLNPAHVEQARVYREELRELWATTRFAYDSDGDGVPDGGDTPQLASAQSSVWLSQAGVGRSRRW